VSWRRGGADQQLLSCSSKLSLRRASNYFAASLSSWKRRIFLAFAISARRVPADASAPALFPTAHQCSYHFRHFSIIWAFAAVVRLCASRTSCALGFKANTVYAAHRHALEASKWQAHVIGNGSLRRETFL